VKNTHTPMDYMSLKVTLNGLLDQILWGNGESECGRTVQL